MAQYTLTEISESTGFDRGDTWESEQAVRDYFTVESMAFVGLGGKALHEHGDPSREVKDTLTLLSQDELDAMAEQVIANKWHCAF